MLYRTDNRRRRSRRLPTWDYIDSGAYFVTICTHDRSLLFGRFAGDDLVLNEFGKVVGEVWRKAVGSRPGEFVIMPNHVHGIIWIQRDVLPKPTVGVEQLRGVRSAERPTFDRDVEGGSAVAQPLRPEFTRTRRGLRDGLAPGSLFVIVRTFKSAAAKRIVKMRGSPGSQVWQRDYYDRIIRDERELQAARAYIQDNPRRWAQDKHNPAVFSDARHHAGDALRRS